MAGYERLLEIIKHEDGIDLLKKMVPDSRRPVRRVSDRNDGNTLRAVWQNEAGLLKAQTQDF
ncbi:MAG: hypothetical protein IKN91_09265 [Paludibacteraceae bacterium]|nr:hypothetical protein [Paludibacteraceae bacterium]